MIVNTYSIHHRASASDKQTKYNWVEMGAEGAALQDFNVKDNITVKNDIREFGLRMNSIKIR
jgi:hypothetical protein